MYFFWPQGRRNHAAVLQPNIWLKVLPKSLHQFRKCFQIKWFRRLTLPSGLWFPCCEICFRFTRWPLASPGTLQIRRYAQRTALCLARHTQTTEADSGNLGPRGQSPKTRGAHFCIWASVSPHYVKKLPEQAPKSRSGSTAQYLAQGL